ncbi:hypothetical protein KI659_17885 [Litoribacter alkaliphilus]|uniref:Uncharacterized protein n=1 Tax=Litoribacter ruber TaxID=702568 RepID=A0AAP2CM83_9BACT|nr:hypothetical protein [Litoribacter alkaliphilus]MBS9525896.1 hypothetical protein [Litoribacter alkaliphilus]
MSAFEEWSLLPGNEGKGFDEFISELRGEDGKSFGFEDLTPEQLASLRGAAGFSAFEEWSQLPGNEEKGFDEFISELRGEDGKSFGFEDFTPEQLASLRGASGFSAFEEWSLLPGNEGKGFDEFISELRGEDGKSFGVEDFTPEQLASLRGASGLSAFEEWSLLPGNEGKGFDEFISELRGEDGKSFGVEDFTPEQLASLRGASGLSAFEEWSLLPGNEGKEFDVFISELRGEDGKSFGFEGFTAEQLASWRGASGLSAFEEWSLLPGNEEKGFDVFISGLRGEDGKSFGFEGFTAEQLASWRGASGLSAFEEWSLLPGNEEKGFDVFISGLRGEDGKSFGFEDFTPEQLASLQGAQGEDGKAFKYEDFTAEQLASLRGASGFSAYEEWSLLPGNEEKGFDVFISGLRGEDGKSFGFEDFTPEQLASLQGAQGEDGKAFKYEDFTSEQLASLRGASGLSAFEEWSLLPGNEEKGFYVFISELRGEDGKSFVFEDFTAEQLASLRGASGFSAYEEWSLRPGKEEKGFEVFISELRGENGKSFGFEDFTAEQLASLRGASGFSAYEEWSLRPGKEEKGFEVFISELRGENGKSFGFEDFTAEQLASLRGASGFSAYEEWSLRPGKEEKGFEVFISELRGEYGKSLGFEEFTAEQLASLRGASGFSAYEEWSLLPGNEEKGFEIFISGLRGEDGKSFEFEDFTPEQLTSLRGGDGLSAYEIWKSLGHLGGVEDFLRDLRGERGVDGNTILSGESDPALEEGYEGDFFMNVESQTLYGPKMESSWGEGMLLKGANGIGLDFRGSFENLESYLAAENEESLNKAYYNISDRKSYIFNGHEWLMFAQDGNSSGGVGDGIEFNVDRNITREGLAGFGMNLGEGKDVAGFLEAFFFPRIAATPPTTTFTSSQLNFPYSVWKNWPDFRTEVQFSWTVANTSKQNDSDDKDIASIRLLSGGSLLAQAEPDNSGISQSGVFANIELKKPNSDLKTDFSQTYVLEVKDEEPNTITKNLTLRLLKAVQLTYPNPSLQPATTLYEYSNEDIPINVAWNINPQDEKITGLKVHGESITNITNSGNKEVKLISPANGGSESQSFTLEVTGDIYGTTTKSTASVSWAGTLYRGSFTSSVSPCSDGFSISDDQIKALSDKKLGGTWKGTAGYDFSFNSSGQYAVFAYPNDQTNQVVEYYDNITGQWIAYPPHQLKVIDREGFVNAKGFSGKSYKIVLVCVEYVSSTAKIRIR